MKFSKLDLDVVRAECVRAYNAAVINAFIVQVMREEFRKTDGATVNKRLETKIKDRINAIKTVNETVCHAYVDAGSPTFRFWYDNKEGFMGRREFVLDIGWWFADRVGGEQGIRVIMPREIDEAAIEKHFGVGWDSHEKNARGLALKIPVLARYVARYNAAIDALQAARDEAATFENDTVYPLTSLFDPRSR